MIGYLGATNGDAFINAVNIRDDMSAVYESMGVCPQDNLLWETLTAQEHLFFYARLKRLTGSAAARAVEEALRGVSLYEVRHKRASKFSGGAHPPAPPLLLPKAAARRPCTVRSLDAPLAAHPPLTATVS